MLAAVRVIALAVLAERGGPVAAGGAVPTCGGRPGRLDPAGRCNPRPRLHASGARTPSPGCPTRSSSRSPPGWPMAARSPSTPPTPPGGVPGRPGGPPGGGRGTRPAALYNIQDLERGRPLLILAALFVGAVVAFGRWQGVRSLVGLGLSFVVIVAFVVPAILRGHSPVLVAVTGAMAIMLVSLYLSHGTGPKTTAAVVGTALALGLTAALAIAFVAATSLTGLASRGPSERQLRRRGPVAAGLLLAGIIIGGLGVLDDVTMPQASLVDRAAPGQPDRRHSGVGSQRVAGRARPHRGHRQRLVPGLCRGGAAAADPFRDRAGLAGHGRHHRARGRGGGPGPVRVGRADRRRAADHGAGRAGPRPRRRPGPSPPYRRRTASTEGPRLACMPARW